MKFFKITLLCILALHRVSANELIEVSSVEKGDFQESAFIKLMSTLNNGKIPYPFSDLLDSFDTGVREEGLVAMVPKGRSLVKESADFKNPRIIVNPIFPSQNNDKFENKNGEIVRKNSHEKIWDDNREKIKDLGIDENDLYIGFAPNHNALEVISYNPKKPGYDFFVVEDYGPGKTPKIVSNPALCLSCHQNEAPIFSRFPWGEFLGDTAKAPRIKKGNVIDTEENQMMDLVREANLHRKNIEGIDITSNERFNVNSVSFFDLSTKIATSKIVANNICETLCSKSDDLSCQKVLIKTFKNNNLNYYKSAYLKNSLSKFNKLENKSSTFPDRDPQSNTGFRSVIDKDLLEDDYGKSFLKEYLETNLGPKETYDITYSEMQFGVEKFIKLEDDSLLNPAFPRPISTELTSLKINISKAETENDKIEILVNACLPNALHDIPAEDITDALLNTPSVNKALSFWPDTGLLAKAIKNEILKDKLSITKDLISCNENIGPVIPVFKNSDIQNVVEKINNEKINKPKALFQMYCTQCHGGEKAFIKLPLESMEEMASYDPKFGKLGIEERLIKNIMPPPYAKQPTEADRLEMIKVIKELSKKK